MRRLNTALLALGMLSACGDSAGSADDGEVRDIGPCGDLIACAQAAGVGGSTSLIATYGVEGSCYDLAGVTPQDCWADCQVQLEALAMVHPDVPECTGGSGATGEEGTSTGGDAGGECVQENAMECNTSGSGVLICSGGVWVLVECDEPCAEANPPPGKQVGACVDQSGDPVCICADGVGGSCSGTEPDTCNVAGQIEFCQGGTVFTLNCSTSCADDDYPVAGPCVSEGQGQGEAACQCADGSAGSCSIAEQFVEGCESATAHRRCVDETWWVTDCQAECARQGQSGGTCQDVGGGNFSCVCG